jgi:streptomycin 6-kinase
MLEHFISLWDLIPDGTAIVTPRAQLLPVLWHGQPAMLKVATELEERFGGVLLAWWDGDGAAHVLEAAGDAILVERATTGRSLFDLVREGRDDEATHIICDVAARLHRRHDRPLPELVPLSVWFRDLEPAAESHGGILTRSLAEARLLLAEPREEGVLHGDIHHENILDFGPRGWLAIDPKRLHGERGFDYANLFCNPDVGDASCTVARTPEHFTSRLGIVVERSGMERRRLLQWIIAWTGLSAAWFFGDGDGAEVDLRIAEMAIAEIDRS